MILWQLLWIGIKAEPFIVLQMPKNFRNRFGSGLTLHSVSCLSRAC